MKKKGIIRKLLFLVILIGGSFLAYEGGYITIDKSNPSIKYSGNKKVFNKNLDNNIIVKDNSDIKYIKMYYKSSDTSNEYVTFYSKKVKYKKTKDFIINLKNTKLMNFFSTTTTNFELKIEAVDNSLYSNTSTLELKFKVDNLGPKIKVIKKSLNMIKKGSLFSMQVSLLDNTGIKEILINNKKDFIVSKGKNKGIYNITYPFTKYPDNNYIILSVSDVVNNINTNKIYFLKAKDNHKIRKITINNKFYNELKNFKTDLKEKDISLFLQSTLKKEIALIEAAIIIDKKNNISGYNKIKDYNFNNYFKTRDKIFISSYGTHYEFIKNKSSKLIYKPNFISNKINSNAYIYPIKEGQIIYNAKLKILKDVIIVKSSGNVYSIYMLLNKKDSLLNGSIVTNETKLGKPNYSSIFKSNTALAIYIGVNYINPSFFINKKMNSLYIKKVFNKNVEKEVVIQGKRKSIKQKISTKKPIKRKLRNNIIIK